MQRRHVKIAALVLAALTFWFLGIDRSWFVEKCPTCGYLRDIDQYRIFTFPVYEHDVEYSTLLQKVAKDIGAECTHPILTRYHKHRYWGLCVCAVPCINGIESITGDISWYNEDSSAKVRKMVEVNPSLREEFVERVIVRRDWDYWTSFLKRLETSSGGDLLPGKDK